MRNIFLLLASLSVFTIGCAQKSTGPDLGLLPHPCFKAASKSDLDYIQKNYEVCKSVKSPIGVTPLMLASARGQVNVINYFIQQGQDVNEADLQGDTALNYAAVGNQVRAVDLLLLAGAEVSTKKSSGITALMTAVQQGSAQMIYSLSIGRSSINDKTEDGWTALYFAIRRKDLEILKWLIHQGACVNIRDQDQQSPMEFAREVQWKEGLDIIRVTPDCKPKK